MAVGIIAAAKVAKRVSKKGRAEAKEKKAVKLDKKAERKNNRADRLAKRAEKKMGQGKMGKAAKLMGKSKKVEGKADIKTGKAIQKREKAGKLNEKIDAGKTVKGRLQKAGKMVSDKVKEKGGVKEIAKNLASKTPAGKIAKKIKDNKPKRDALKNERQDSRARKRAIRKGEGTTEAAPKKVKIESSSVKEKKAEPVVAGAPGMYNKTGMPYYKGKISYGHHSGMKMSGYAKAGLAGKGLSMNSQQKLSKHFKK